MGVGSGIEFTDFGGWSTAEVRALARSLDGEAIAADARAVGAAGERLVDSLAQLEADVAALRERWTGTAADGAFTRIERYVSESYDAGGSAAALSGAVDALAAVADSTHTSFADLAASLSPWREIREAHRAAVAAALRTGYSTPIADVDSTLSTHPLVTMPAFERLVGGRVPSDSAATTAAAGGRDDVPVLAGAAPGVDSAATGTEPAGGTPARGRPDAGTKVGADGRAGKATPGAVRSAGAGAERSGTAGGGAAVASGGESAPTGYQGTSHIRTGGEATGVGLGADRSRAIDSAGDDDAGHPLPLLASASQPRTGWAGASGGHGSGLVSGGTGRASAASPFGLRAEPRGVATAPSPPLSAGPGEAPGARPPGAASAARPSAAPMAVPPAAAGRSGTRDAEHRAPGYLIGRENGEEVVGELPLVGPTVIGDWRR